MLLTNKTCLQTLSISKVIYVPSKLSKVLKWRLSNFLKFSNSDMQVRSMGPRPGGIECRASFCRQIVAQFLNWCNSVGNFYEI